MEILTSVYERYWLSQNPNITWDVVNSNPDKPWDWFWLSRHPNITWDVITSNPEKPWDWSCLSRNITWDMVTSNPEKPWDWHGLSQNPNITWDMVTSNPEKPWDWGALSTNLMILQRKIYMVQIIETWWLKKMYSPNSKFVNEVIRPRFNEMKASNNLKHIYT